MRSEQTVSPPVLLLGAGVLFWGWQAQLLALAIPMAVIVEASRYVPWRWEFSDRELNRLADLTNLLFAGAAVYLFSRYGPHGVYAVIRWLPAVLFLLMAAQFYSTRGNLNLGSLFLSVRRYQTNDEDSPSPRIDLSYPYFATCLVSAGVAAYETPWLYPGVLLLTVWGISSVRPRRYSALAWTGVILLAASLGYSGQWGIRGLQLMVEDLVLAWVQDRPWSDTDPYRSRTAIGHIGRLKFSDRILLRVRRLDRGTDPLLLRQASYQTYRGAAWHAGRTPFEPLPPGAQRGTWLLGDDSDASGRIHISGPLDNGRAVLALPGGASRIDDLHAPGLKANPYGTVRLDDGPGFVSFSARFAPASGRDQAPTDADLRVPKHQQASIERVSRELGLPGQPTETVIERLRAFFTEDFRYSLAPDPRLHDLPPLAQFLLHSRRGHCEYFATATVLLLRSAGVPSRYATGYAVQEAGADPGLFVVRDRHAHAWALAYRDGQWVDVDLTPAVWAALEEEQAPWWLPAYDLFSAAAFAFSRWRWSGEGDDELPVGVYVALIASLAIFLAWRLHRQKRTAATDRQRPGRPSRAPESGIDSDFFRLLPYLEHKGRPRRPGETIRDWLSRLGHGANTADLKEALGLHYRYRFDPNGISGSDKTRLRTLVKDWLATRTPDGTEESRTTRKG